MLRLFLCCGKKMASTSCNIGPECMATAEKFTFDGRQMLCFCPAEGVYDGDTFVAVTYLEGWTNPVKLRCRIKGIDTSEIRGGNEFTKKLGLAAKNYLLDLIGDKTLMIEMGAFDMYGRILVDLYLPEANISLAETMVMMGHAVRYDGRGAKKDDVTIE